MEKIKLAAFDLDGTVSTKAGVSEVVLRGYQHFQNRQVLTTLVTGKSLRQLDHRLGKNLDLLVSHDTPVCTENGGRIALDHRRNLIYHPLRSDEIDVVRELLKQFPHDIAAVAYYPQKGHLKMVAWSPGEEDISKLVGKDIPITEIPTEPESSFFGRAKKDRPCMVVIVAKDQALVDELPSSINVVRNEGVLNINTHGVNKATATTQLSEYLKIPLQSVMVCGNDENDIPMLNLQGVGRKIFVGNRGLSNNLPSDTIKVANPDELGNLMLGY